jgi:hypothetical protein
MARIFLRHVNEAGNYNFGKGFLKELLIQAELASGLYNGEDLPTPGE